MLDSDTNRCNLHPLQRFESLWLQCKIMQRLDIDSNRWDRNVQRFESLCKVQRLESLGLQGAANGIAGGYEVQRFK